MGGGSAVRPVKPQQASKPGVLSSGRPGYGKALFSLHDRVDPLHVTCSNPDDDQCEPAKPASTSTVLSL